MLKLYNTLGHKKEKFNPLRKGQVGIYCCGPTVYSYAHLGNLRTYLFEDILRRVLEYNGQKVKQVMNITDVGHLTSDADTGEDKIEKEAREERKTVWQIARFYTKAFKQDLKRLNIKEPDVWIKATETIKDQIDLIKILEKKGFTYKISDGVYFDSSKLKTYGRLTGKKKKELRAGARVKMVPGKKHPTDFALWKLTPPGVKRQMEWPSPWGRGFPGWHTECVAMSIKILGIPFDIHCGGIDHIPIHHTNEIAQAEAAFGKILANYWLHGQFLILKKSDCQNSRKTNIISQGIKMAKSEGNIIILDDIIKRKINPMAFRYLCLTAHYRSPLIFSWQSLKASQRAWQKLNQKVRDWITLSPTLQRTNKKVSKQKTKLIKRYQKKFLSFINNDINIPQALALAWQIVDNKNLLAQEKYQLLIDFDKVFGLGLSKIKKQRIPAKIRELIKKRERERQAQNWQKADELRRKIEKLGFKIEDTKTGPKVKTF